MRDKVTLFSPYGQRRLGHELLRQLRLRETAGDGDSSAELGTAYLDANGVDFDVDCAMSHFNKGAKAGNPFCQFRLAEFWFHTEYLSNPYAEASLRSSYDQIWSAAQAGVGEAYVSLHFLHLRLRGSPSGAPAWLRTKDENRISMFMTALRACYDYLEGGSPTECLDALELLAHSGFPQAYFAASIVASEGCRDPGRAHENLRTAVENGVTMAIDYLLECFSDSPSDPQFQPLFEIAAEHGNAKAFVLTLDQLPGEAYDEALVRRKTLRFLQSSPRYFSDASLVALGWLCAKCVQLIDEAELKSAAEQTLEKLAKLGHVYAIGELHSLRLFSDMKFLQQINQQPGNVQLAVAEHIGRVFLSAIAGYGEAWNTVATLHILGTLTDHQGVGQDGPHKQRSCGAVLVSGLMYEKLTGKECENVSKGFGLINGRDYPDYVKKHVEKEMAQIRRHRLRSAMMLNYGLARSPAERLLHESETSYKFHGPHDYPGLPCYPPRRPNWPTTPFSTQIRLSQNPFRKGWIHPRGAADPACLAMRKHLSSGDIAGACRYMFFDNDSIPRLLTLAAGAYEIGRKDMAIDLLAYAIFNLDGQRGLAHHMLAWVMHETGRTTGAIRVCLDCFEACEFDAASDTDVVEFNLLLAELLMLYSHRAESENVILRIKSHAPHDSKLVEKCARIETIDTFEPFSWMIRNPTKKHVIQQEPQNPSAEQLILKLTNMDRHRCLFRDKPDSDIFGNNQSHRNN